MCSANRREYPPYEDAPTPQRPRRYVLAGGKPEPSSMALAVLGDMLETAEHIERETTGPTRVAIQRAIVATLRVARQRVADAESRR